MVDWKRPQPAPLALWRVVHANFPVARNVGIYVNRNVAGTTTPSAHAEGRALDIGLDVRRPNEMLIGDQLFQALITCAGALGIDHVIWNRRIWSAARAGPRAYTGQSPHTDHIHVAWTRDGSQRIQMRCIELRIAEFRTGLEDLSRGYANLA